jgi:hypothetical protein
VPAVSIDAAPITETASPADESPAGAGYQVVVYPSATVRPIPPFVFCAPDGWVVDEAPDAIAVVRQTEAVDDFWINAILTHDRVAKAVDLPAAAQLTWTRLTRDAPTAKSVMERVVNFGGNVVYLRGVEVEAPRSGRKLAQLQAIFLAPAADDAKTADLFQFVATSPIDKMDAVGKSFVEMIGTFRFV